MVIALGKPLTKKEQAQILLGNTTPSLTPIEYSGVRYQGKAYDKNSNQIIPQIKFTATGTIAPSAGITTTTLYTDQPNTRLFISHVTFSIDNGNAGSAGAFIAQIRDNSIAILRYDLSSRAIIIEDYGNNTLEVVGTLDIYLPAQSAYITYNISGWLEQY